MRYVMLLAIAAAGLLLSSAGMASSRVKADIPSNTMRDLHVVGNHLVNTDGAVVTLHGVNRSGTEYACVQGWDIFNGPSDAASVDAIASWRANAVRVPLNEDCWLGINGVDPAYSGANYQKAIAAYVRLLNQHGMATILDLHWTAPGAQSARSQMPMPDKDHSIAFWRGVARAYRDNQSVLFDLFNEPYPDSNQDTSAAWACWRDGGVCADIAYPVAGMQTLVNTVRAAGAKNVIVLGGVQYANALSGWLAYKPRDPAGNLVASWHSYDGQQCSDSRCWDRAVAPVAARVPIVSGEIGESDCAHRYIDGVMAWLDRHGGSYLAWSWNLTADGRCHVGQPASIALLLDFAGTPMPGMGQGYHDHLAAL
jgi:endoglucanase